MLQQQNEVSEAVALSDYHSVTIVSQTAASFDLLKDPLMLLTHIPHHLKPTRQLCCTVLKPLIDKPLVSVLLEEMVYNLVCTCSCAYEHATVGSSCLALSWPLVVSYGALFAITIPHFPPSCARTSTLLHHIMIATIIFSYYNTTSVRYRLVAAH